MFTSKLLHACILLIVLSSNSAWAQFERNSEPPGGHYSPVPPWPPDLFFSYDHASTALEGALRGTAALRYAEGSFLNSASQAAILSEQARWLALNNRQRWIEYRIALRRWGEFDRQARIAEKRPKNEARRLSRYAAHRLGPDQLDSSGRIAWPGLLQAAEYDDLRHEIEEVFGRAARFSASAEQKQEAIADSVNRLKGAIHQARSQFDQDEYFAAQRFLSVLKYNCELSSPI